MTVYATCGHEINPDWLCILYVALKAIVPDFDLDRLAHAVSYQVLCPRCLGEAAAADEILHNEQEAQEWLNG